MIVFFVLELQKKKTPDKDEYRRIEYDIPLEIAKIAK